MIYVSGDVQVLGLLIHDEGSLGRTVPVGTVQQKPRPHSVPGFLSLNKIAQNCFAGVFFSVALLHSKGVCCSGTRVPGSQFVQGVPCIEKMTIISSGDDKSIASPFGVSPSHWSLPLYGSSCGDEVTFC